MELIPLGIGGAISNPLLGNISFMVNINNINILIDAGEGAYRVLRMCGFDINDINLILITHKHSDHIGGLMTLTLFAAKNKLKLRIYGPDDLDLKCLFKAFGNEQYINLVDFNPIKPLNEITTVINDEHYKVHAISMTHSIPTLAYRIEDKDGNCITYSGDTTPNDNIIKLAKNCKILIYEISRNPGLEMEAHADGHSTTADAIKIAKEAGVKYLLPVHFYVEPPIFTNLNNINIIIPIPCTPINLNKI